MEEWVDEDNFGPAITEEDTHISANKNSRVVVLKHMFTPKELEEDPTLLLDLKEDVREECETLGEVTNVVLYDVRDNASLSTFSSQQLPTERAGRCYDCEVQGSHQRASMCFGTYISFVPAMYVPTLNLRKPMQKMQGRFFSGRKVEASLWIGKQHFKRSGVAEDVEEVGGGDEGEKKRLDAFAHWLLTEGD